MKIHLFITEENDQKKKKRTKENLAINPLSIVKVRVCIYILCNIYRLLICMTNFQQLPERHSAHNLEYSCGSWKYNIVHGSVQQLMKQIRLSGACRSTKHKKEITNYFLVFNFFC